MSNNIARSDQDEKTGFFFDADVKTERCCSYFFLQSEGKEGEAVHKRSEERKKKQKCDRDKRRQIYSAAFFFVCEGSGR